MTGSPGSRVLLSGPDLGEAEIRAAVAALEAGEVGSFGAQPPRFEAALAARTGFAHVAAVASGTAAMHLALKLAGVRAGDAVIAPTFTFIGGVAPIAQLGAVPIFVDCEADSFGLAPEAVEAAFALARREGLTVRAVAPADLFGRCTDLTGILAIARAHGATVVADSAEALGATRDGRHAGLQADLAVYSFNANKIITAVGGGAVASGDPALIERARRLANQGRTPGGVEYEHEEPGFNYRLPALLAAIGAAQMDGLDARIARRRRIHDLYRARLGVLDGVRLDDEAPGERATRWLTVMQLSPGGGRPGPRALIDVLAARGIEARPVWKPMHRQRAFAGGLHVGGETADRLHATSLCLPSGSRLTDADIDRVCEAVTAALTA